MEKTENSLKDKQLSEEEKLKHDKLCAQLDLILSNLTDFDIKVSQLRTNFMNYTKAFLNSHFSLETPEKREELLKEKDDYLVSYSEKMNDLNQMLQKYKLELYVIKNKDKCENKNKNILNDVQTNFINLINLLRDEIKETKIPISFIMINLNSEKEKTNNNNKNSIEKENNSKKEKEKSQLEEMEKENVIL